MCRCRAMPDLLSSRAAQLAGSVGVPGGGGRTAQALAVLPRMVSFWQSCVT